MMKSLRYFAIGLVLGIGGFWGVSAALAQGRGSVHLSHPTVIDIQQSVPLLAEIDGATVPFTVSVALQVDLSGPVTASAEAAPMPVMEVATATPQLATDEAWNDLGEIVLEEVHWRLIEVINEGRTFDYLGELSSDYYETSRAKFVALHFDVENTSSDPVNLGYYVTDYWDYGMRLVDDRDRIFAPYNLGRQWDSECEYVDLNPGISADCYVVFELPEEAKGLRIQFLGRSYGSVSIAAETATPTPLPITGTASNYSELLRNTEQYIGTTIQFEGEVLEVRENRLGYIEYLNVDAVESDQAFEGQIAVRYVGSDRFVAGDRVRVEGVVTGRFIYDAVLGNQVTLPQIESTSITPVD